MIIHQVAQGSAEWHAIRANHKTASEAAIIMGNSPYANSREVLMQQKKFGIVQEVSTFVQERIYDKGHALEALARPILEQQLGKILYPVTVSEGDLLASLDGATDDYETLFEHKKYRADLAEFVDRGEVPPGYEWQLEQGLHITKAKRVIFVLSDGTEENWSQCEYTSNPEKLSQLLAGWQQFDRDMAAYVLPEQTAAPIVNYIAPLPALAVVLSGEVRASNLVAYRDEVNARIEAISTDLKTDDDFANAKAMVKFLSGCEAEIKQVEKQALAQNASIAEAFEMLATTAAAMRDKRLALDRLVKARESKIKADIVQEYTDKAKAYEAELNAEVGFDLPFPALSLVGAMSGKKLLSSIRAACDNEVTRHKIAASELAKKVRDNQAVASDLVADFPFLFPNINSLVIKNRDDMCNAIEQRIAVYQREQVVQAEKEKAKQAAAEAERQATREREQAADAAFVQAVSLPPVTPAAASWQAAPVDRRDTRMPMPPSLERRQVIQLQRGAVVSLIAEHYKLPAAEVEAQLVKLFKGGANGV